MVPPIAQRRVNPIMVSEAEAKAEWLSKLDAPAWGAAAKAMSTVAAEAAQFQVCAQRLNPTHRIVCAHRRLLPSVAHPPLIRTHV